MKSMCLAETGKAIVAQQIPRPVPSPGEVLIRVRAAGVTATELSWYPTLHTKEGGKRAAAVPSHEFSGEIAELGSGAAGLLIGQEVYGMNDWYADGALAEFCISKPAWVAPKPSGLSPAEAASLPIGALTAWQGLFDRAHLQPGERALIQGGAGAVGALAVQLAHHRGAHVIATVSTRDLEFVRTLGADEAIDYKAAPFEERAQDIDVVFDTVGGEILQLSWNVLKEGGRLVTIVSTDQAAADERSKSAFFIVEPDGHRLVEIGKLLATGELRPVVDTILPFAQAPLAYSGKVEKTGRGKLVVAITD